MRPALVRAGDRLGRGYEQDRGWLGSTLAFRSDSCPAAMSGRVLDRLRLHFWEAATTAGVGA